MGAAHQARPFDYTPLGYSGETDANSGEIDATTPDSYSAMAVAPSSASLVLTSVETTIEYAWAS